MKTMMLPVFAAVLAMILITPLSSYAISGQPSTNSSKSSAPISQPLGTNANITSNQIAAGGPIPPNFTMAQQEAQCAAAQPNPPWFRTVIPAEHFDSGRIDLFACAQFPGSYTGPNAVYAHESTDMYRTPFNLATRGINELYIYGGGTGDAKPPALQTYVARIDPTTMKEVWRTYLNNANLTNELHLSGAVDILSDGNIGAAADHTLYKINATSGAIMASVNLPTGNNPPTDSAFNGFSAWPDGLLVLKSFNRPVGCTLNGYSAAAFKRPGAPNSANPSVLSVVDPKTWKVLGWVQGTENSAGRISAAQFHGKDYAYFAGSTNVYRHNDHIMALQVVPKITTSNSTSTTSTSTNSTPTPKAGAS